MANNLVENTAQVGDYLYSGMEKLQSQYPDQILNLRGKGQGTFIAFDHPMRDELAKQMKLHGVHMGACGVSAVRLRPMLVFQKKHADIFLEKLGTVLGKMPMQNGHTQNGHA